MVEVESLTKIDEVRNQKIIIESYLACGIPGYKVKWHNSEGKEFNIYFCNDGYGFDGEIINSK